MAFADDDRYDDDLSDFTHWTELPGAPTDYEGPVKRRVRV